MATDVTPPPGTLSPSVYANAPQRPHQRKHGPIQVFAMTRDTTFRAPPAHDHSHFTVTEEDVSPC